MLSHKCFQIITISKYKEKRSHSKWSHSRSMGVTKIYILIYACFTVIPSRFAVGQLPHNGIISYIYFLSQRTFRAQESWAVIIMSRWLDQLHVMNSGGSISSWNIIEGNRFTFLPDIQLQYKQNAGQNKNLTFRYGVHEQHITLHTILIT